ncbi:MAG TPA: winged helix-turn-helix domain-containing protein [Burkholderiaceae bacterium]|jgi:TolB-like protein/DNA-binding winged helix-turn-helix (wHTH) protein
MSSLPSKVFHVGPWRVDPASGELTREGESARLETRTLRLLAYLAERAGEVVTIDELLDHAWAGVMVTPDSVYQAIATLRRTLGDDPKQPTYIATVPRFGYRLIAKVYLAEEQEGATAAGISEAASPQRDLPPDSARPTDLAPAKRRPPVLSAAVGAVLVLLTITLVVWVHATRSDAQIPSATVKSNSASNTAGQHGPAPTVRSIAVMPFLDLTDQMNEEPFADGMAEELIGKLSKVPGLAVSPPTSSFYYKDKQVSVAEVAAALHADYVLDGSVRKSGDTLRVSTRLTRARDGFVVWSESYDRSWRDKLMIQDDIAGEVAKALATSLN